MFSAVVYCQLVLQIFVFWVHDAPAMLQHRVGASLNLRFERLVLAFEVDEGDGHVSVVHI
jgi:hypothetical protein